MPIRSDSNAYQRYLRGMDASVRQKVALTAAHVLCEGVVEACYQHLDALVAA